ncbi:SNF2 super family [Micromonas commoda]|uniref:SNF2 super family n=1 Tax=Micromonas commoda (strain RCC299 / NOUM17 / CCMP2709) TaxID=296587 RepID=C1EH46_MICCC|nr:SNF2 super family [Micromonas commoda]ACO67442.1 SNF2 super family [Micromonas commoda]|eukprot:XP_002506184.1 SNF2 super family [Micromonas commoda]
MGGRKRAEPQRLVPGDGAAAAKRVKKEEVKAEVKVEPGVDEPIDLTGVSDSDPDDDAKLADSLRGGPRTIVDAPLYPPTIAFDDPFHPRGVPVRCPPDWHTVDGANAAAERIRNEVRLLGVATLTLASAPGEAHARATLASLAAGVRASKRTVRKNYRGPAGVETWNDVGEPGSARGTSVPVGKLAECVSAGILDVAEPHGLPLLHALAGGQHPVTSPWKVPLTRCVCLLEAVSDAPANPPGAVGGSHEGETESSQSTAVKVELAVYASRLMFEMIADDGVRLIVSHLAPPVPVAKALETEVLRPARFYVDAAVAGADTAGAGPFTLPGLLAAAVSDGYDECPTPPNLALPLMDFQRQTLAWMRDKERSERGLNGVFWEERRWADGGKYWYFPLAGELRLSEPPLVRGGMLSEEMGLGKTLEVLALVSADADAARAAVEAKTAAAKEEPPEAEEEEEGEEGEEDRLNGKGSRNADHPDEDEDEDDAEERRQREEEDRDGLIPSRATLIIVPPPLLRQWEAECAKCVRPGTMKIGIHSGRGRGGRGAPRQVSERELASKLADNDVVLATYPSLQKEAKKRRRETGTGDGASAPRNERAQKILSRVSWRRVVLDECQMVRSSTTQLAVACRCLVADFRWMVSGTPLHGGVDDLNGELAFLGVWPFCLSDQTDGFWAHRVGRPWAAKDPDALPLLHALLRGVIVRHTKAQRRIVDGTPLLTLPRASRVWRPVVHGYEPGDASERFVCAFLEHHAAAAARGALATLQTAWLAGEYQGSSRATQARLLAQRLLRLVRGATTSATLVRSRLRDVDQALRAAATAPGGVGGAGHGDGVNGRGAGGLRNRGLAGTVDVSAAEAAADADFCRVRALPAGAALVELMTARDAQEVRVARQGDASGASGAALSAFQLRNRDMHTFEASVQAWRGTSREYADAGGSDLAHKLAAVCGNVFKLLAKGDERAPGREGITCGTAANVAKERATRQRQKRLLAHAGLHALQHAFPGRLNDLCGCNWSPCPCSRRIKSSDDPSCCEALEAHRALSDRENKSGRVKEAVKIARSVAAAATEAIADARAPLPKLRWLLAVELITSGAAFRLFREHGQPPETLRFIDDDFNDVDANALGSLTNLSEAVVEDRRRLGVRFLRRALLADALAAPVRSADADVETRRARAQARDPTTNKPTRAIRDAPEEDQLALERARAAKRDAEARLRDELPGGCRPVGGALVLAVPAASPAYSGAGGPLSALAVAATLRDAIAAHSQHANRLANEVGSLLPYLRALRAAGEAGADWTSLDHATVQQSGFDLLNEVMAGKAPQCCICVQPAVHPCIARCMHLACTRCMVTWYHAAPLHGGGASSAPPCPLCRKPFTIDELIRLIPPAEEEDVNGEEEDEEGKGTEARAGGSKERRRRRNGEERNDAREEPARNDAVEVHGAVVRFTPAARPSEFSRLPLPDGENPADYRDGRYPALSMDGGRFLAHLHRASMRQSPKMSALVRDLREALAAPGGSGKAVVFSQLRDALAHAEQVLRWEGIGCESVGVHNRGGGVNGGTNGGTNGGGTNGSNNGSGEGAIARFRDDPATQVLLLHAGSAAAGLTLTQADLVVLLEPFLSPGDEAQAANRVHRIGQTRPVRCVTYFVEGTVEERLLAFRTRQREFGAEFGGGDGTVVGSIPGDGDDDGDDPEGDGERADRLAVTRDGGDLGLGGGSIGRRTFERMRFVFGIGDGRSTAEGATARGADVVDLANE